MEVKSYQNTEIPSPLNYGWTYKEDKTSNMPKWSELPVVVDVLRQLVKCKCKKPCSGNCKCNTMDLKCTPLFIICHVLINFIFNLYN